MVRSFLSAGMRNRLGDHDYLVVWKGCVHQTQHRSLDQPDAHDDDLDGHDDGDQGVKNLPAS